eukprot:2938543-Pleurochrysis_carterae.AAC.1
MAPAQQESTFGRGWYFSRYASYAHYFSNGSGHLLLALVAVGNTETVVRRNASRGAPSPGFDAIITPGRPLPSKSPSALGAWASGRSKIGAAGRDVHTGDEALREEGLRESEPVGIERGKARKNCEESVLVACRAAGARRNLAVTCT